MILFSTLDATRETFVRMAPDMPPGCWLLTVAILTLLAMAAVIDIFTARIPNFIPVLGLVSIFLAQGILFSWFDAGKHLLPALAAGALIWAINEIWYRLFRHDALGMGDAKWTMLAVFCFGVYPALLAWGIGSILAVIFLVGTQIARRKITRVTFAPFLFAGLCAGLYWVRL